MGPNPPVDEYSVQTFPDDVPKFLENPAVQAKLATTKRLSEVKAADYDAVFYIGGHGPVLDLPQDPENIKLASDFWRSGKLTTAVCHGPAALVNVTDARGESIFKGRRATAFADEEEQLMHAEKVSGRNLGSSIDMGPGQRLYRPFLSSSKTASRSSGANTKRLPSRSRYGVLLYMSSCVVDDLETYSPMSSWMVCSSLGRIPPPRKGLHWRLIRPCQRTST